MLKGAGCLLAAAAFQIAMTKGDRERRKRRSKYGMYDEKLMKHMGESDERFFKKFGRVGPEMELTSLLWQHRWQNIRIQVRQRILDYHAGTGTRQLQVYVC